MDTSPSFSHARLIIRTYGNVYDEWMGNKIVTDSDLCD